MTVRRIPFEPSGASSVPIAVIPTSTSSVDWALVGPEPRDASVRNKPFQESVNVRKGGPPELVPSIRSLHPATFELEKPCRLFGKILYRWVRQPP
jgi:hypothetical protein